MTRLARAVVALRWWVVAAWAVATVLAVTLGPKPPELKGIDVTSLVPDDAVAIEVATSEVRTFGAPLVVPVVGVIRDVERLGAPDRAVIYQGSAQATVSGEFDPIVIAAPIVNRARWGAISTETDTAALIYLTMRPDTGVQRQVDAATDFVRSVAPAGAFAGVTGAAPAEGEQGTAIADALGPMTLATLLVVVLTVGVWFRAAPIPLIVLAGAGTAYLCASHASAFLAGFGIPFPGEVEPLVVALVLGVTTDYAVFLLHATRRHVAWGVAPHEAVARALASHLPIIGGAALTVAGGSCALFAARLEFLRDLAPALALSALVSALVALTLVPAVAAILGGRLFWPRRPAPLTRRSRLRPLVATRRRAAVTLTATIAALVLLAAGMAGMRLDVALVSGLPGDSEARQAALQAERGFAPGAWAPSVVYVEGSGLHHDRRALSRLQRDLARQPGVAAAVGPGTVPADAPGGMGFLVAEDGSAARFLVVLDAPPLSPDAVDDVRALGGRLPALLDAAGLEGASAAIGGYTSLADATVTAVSSDFRRVAILIVLLSLVLIGIFLRSAIGALLLVAGSGLALLAALGAATWLLQGPLDERGMPYYVPLAATVLLISLGADYAIFFAGRIWQEARRRGLSGAIASALDEESDALGTAGLALALSFAALAIIPVDAFRVLGAVMAAGVLLDTLVIRPIAFPAALTLIGRRAGWPGARLEQEDEPG